MQTEWLQRWWSRKYNRPRKDPVLLSYTYEELMLEYLEDLIEHDPNQAFSPTALEEGRVVRVTGDAVVDRWEKEIADGKAPDLTSSIAAADRDRFAAWMSSSKKSSSKAPTTLPVDDGFEEFADTYKE